MLKALFCIHPKTGFFFCSYLLNLFVCCTCKFWLSIPHILHYQWQLVVCLCSRSCMCSYWPNLLWCFQSDNCTYTFHDKHVFSKPCWVLWMFCTLCWIYKELSSYHSCVPFFCVLKDMQTFLTHVLKVPTVNTHVWHILMCWVREKEGSLEHVDDFGSVLESNGFSKCLLYFWSILI